MDHSIAGRFDEYGFPFLEIQVWNKQQEVFLPAKAIIDTGAAHCMIREELALQLQLPELRVADYRHPVFGTMPLKEYIMDLRFDTNPATNSPVLEGVRAGTLIDLNYPAGVIIGVELLKHCSFSYNGQNKTFTLTTHS
jgi:predicted aspartyl protease